MRNCYNKSCQRLWKEKGKEADKREDLQGLNLEVGLKSKSLQNKNK